MTTPTPANRYVTGHDAAGRAIFRREGAIPYTAVSEKSGQSALFGVPWQTSQFPADNASDEDAVTEGGPLHNENGTLCRIVEFPPNTSSPFHRTVSVDYGILVSGTMYLELDDGAERELHPGDIVVQRGTMHAWHNKTNEWARMVFVLVAANPVVVNGNELGDEMLS